MSKAPPTSNPPPPTNGKAVHMAKQMVKDGHESVLLALRNALEVFPMGHTLLGEAPWATLAVYWGRPSHA